MKSFSYKFRSGSPILFTCEHASRRIPREYNRLGLRLEDLKNSKDWNDPGSYDLMRLLAEHFQASFLTANFSRLVIDANRRLDATTAHKDTFYSCALKQNVLVETESGEHLVPIPGNVVKNGVAEEKRRWNAFVRPYQEKGIELAKKILSAHDQCILVQIHSFYPTYNGKLRTVDIDVVSDVARPSLSPLISALKKQKDYKIGDNKPWGMKDVDGGIFDSLQKRPSYTVFAFDVNNKNLGKKTDIKAVSGVITQALKTVLSFT